jgi:hypothetical protein
LQVSYTDQVTFFELPQLSINHLPFVSLEERLSFGFIEVGCRSSGKLGQLKSKRELFYKYWGDTIRYKNVDWLPRIYRILVHYNPNSKPLSLQ